MTTYSRQGCGVLFFDEVNRRVLLFLRDNKPDIRFPNYIDILGGIVEKEETPEAAIVREMAEELTDLRTGSPYLLEKFYTFKVYIDQWNVEQHVFWKEANFGIEDVHLNEGQALVWLKEEEAQTTALAFGFEAVIRKFFKAHP
ncbi:MAG: NUDIX domain-containing protein [bacterium]|nr:NUDIX domain-containing protein [bacterium]